MIGADCIGRLSPYHNVRIKTYPSGMQKMTIASYPMFKDKRDDGGDQNSVSSSKPDEKQERGQEKRKKAGESTRDDSTKRSRDRAYDIAMMNEWEYFITWTLSEEKIDRYDVKSFNKKLFNFLHDRVKRDNLRYIVIPEYHKDRALHAHALISGDIRMVDSGTITTKGLKAPRRISEPRRSQLIQEGWQIVYNMPQWKLGWSTAVKVYGEPKNFCAYIMKYITKDNKMIFGNYYWAGGDIRREPDIHLTDTDYKALDSKEYYIEQAHCGFKYLNVNSDGEVF